MLREKCLGPRKIRIGALGAVEFRRMVSAWLAGKLSLKKSVQHLVVHDIANHIFRHFRRIQRGTQGDGVVYRVIVPQAPPPLAQPPTNLLNLYLVVEKTAVNLPIQSDGGVMHPLSSGNIFSPLFPPSFPNRFPNVRILAKKLIYFHESRWRPLVHDFGTQDDGDGFQDLPWSIAAMITDSNHPPVWSLAADRVGQSDVGVKGGINIRTFKTGKGRLQRGAADPLQQRKVFILFLHCLNEVDQLPVLLYCRTPLSQINKAIPTREAVTTGTR
jgi:hypothetical protein